MVQPHKHDGYYELRLGRFTMARFEPTFATEARYD